MRINYYEFPETVDAHTRFKNGASRVTGECNLGKDNCRGCDVCADGWRECSKYVCTESEISVDAITITEAKRLLKEFGGFACTQHFERDGTLFETTPITLKGNNSKFKYNRHL